MEGEVDALAIAFDGDRDGFVLVERRTLVDLIPVRIIDGIEVGDQVAGLKAGLGGG